MTRVKAQRLIEAGDFAPRAVERMRQHCLCIFKCGAITKVETTTGVTESLARLSVGRATKITAPRVYRMKDQQTAEEALKLVLDSTTLNCFLEKDGWLDVKAKDVIPIITRAIKARFEKQKGDIWVDPIAPGPSVTAYRADPRDGRSDVVHGELPRQLHFETAAEAMPYGPCYGCHQMFSSIEMLESHGCKGIHALKKLVGRPIQGGLMSPR